MTTADTTCTVTLIGNEACGETAIWLVGLQIDEIWAHSYDACNAHLAEAARRVVDTFSSDSAMNGRLELQNLPRLREWEQL